MSHAKSDTFLLHNDSLIRIATSTLFLYVLLYIVSLRIIHPKFASLQNRDAGVEAKEVLVEGHFLTMKRAFNFAFFRGTVYLYS